MRKCECGNQVANNAKSCPKCGHRFTSDLTKLVAALFAACFGIVIIALVSNPGSNITPIPQTSPQAVASASPSMSTGNEANDRMLALPESEQASNLGKVVNEGCVGKRAFYMGTSPTDHSAFWSVGCKNGKKYLVQIEADATGSTKVLECGLYKAVTKMSCFTKLDN